MTPALSVVIPCSRRADLLRLCLASVRSYAPPHTEIIVVDDGSPNASAMAASGDARVVRFARSRGFCVAANAGIAIAHAPIVELLNDDCEVAPGWADSALRRFTDPAVAAVAPLVLQYGDPRTIDSAGDEYDFGGIARKIGHGRRLSGHDMSPREVFGASASSAFYRRTALVSAGSFPESFGAYFEDVDLAFRLRRNGGRVVCDPTSVVFHRGGASYGRPARQLVERQSCNEERVFWRNLSPAELRRWLPRHAAVLCGKALRRWEEGRLIPWLTGRIRAWATIPADRVPWRAAGID